MSKDNRIGATHDGISHSTEQYFDANNIKPGDVASLVDLAIIADSASSRFGNGKITFGRAFGLAFGALAVTACGAAAATNEIPTPGTVASGSVDTLTVQPTTVVLESTNIDTILTATPGVPPTVINQEAISEYVSSQAAIPDYLSADEAVNPPLETVGATLSPLSRLTLDQYGFVPVLGADGLSGYEHTQTYYPKPMAEISSADGIPLKLDVSGAGDWYVYRSANGQVVQYMPKSVVCRGECVTAVSYNENAPGVTQIFDINPDTGEINGVAQAFYTSENDVVKFGDFDKDKWRTAISGPDAIMLGMTDGADGMAYDKESNTISFQVGETVVWADIYEFKNSSEFGFYVTSDEGVFVWGDNGWVKAEESSSPSGAKRYVVEEKNFVEMNGAMVWVGSVSEANGNITVVKDGHSFTWESGEWLATPDLTPAQQAELDKTNKTYGGVLIVAKDGTVTDANGNTPEGFGYNKELGVLTRTYYSELLGREITEPMSGILKYAEGKPTGEIDFPNCSYKDGVCSSEYAIDPVTGKEVEKKHSIFEMMLLQLQDMVQMTEQDKLNAYDFSGKHFDALIRPNNSFSDGQRYWVYKDAKGLEHRWPLYDNQHVWSNQLFVKNEGILRAVPYFIFGSSMDGKTGMAVWEVNGMRREVFIDSPANITKLALNPDLTLNNNTYPFVIDKEWLPGEYELLPFD